LARLTTWAGQAVKQTGWNLNPRTAFGGLALVGGLALLAAFYLALSSQTAVLGRQLQEIEATRAKIVRENASLRDQIARDVSVSELTQRAASAGFVFTGTVHFITITPTPRPEIDVEGSPTHP
jgi:hypothetical protein